MMTTTSSPKMLDPDEECLVCGHRREIHGDMKHQFSTDGNLRAKPQPEPARQQAPTERGQQLAKDPTTAAMLRIVEVLIQKDILKGEDLVYIFGGARADS